MPAKPSLIHLYQPDPTAVVPLGVRFNDTLYAWNLTGQPGESLTVQMQQALQAMKGMLERAGCSLANVGRCTGYVTHVEDRELIYGPWDALFPDPADRPAFKALVTPLPPGQLVRLDMLAVVGGTRTRIDIAGVPARDPTVKIANWVFTSRVHGTDPTTGKVKEGGIAAEVAQAYDNIVTLAKLAGGEPRHITQVTAFLRDPGLASQVTAGFDRTFPQPGPRPRFNVLQAFIPGHLNVMLEMSATLQ